MTELLRMTQEEFREEFRKSPTKRAKRRGLLRNIAAGLSSSQAPDAEEALRHALNDPDALVRQQIEQSLTELGRVSRP